MHWHVAKSHAKSYGKKSCLGKGKSGRHVPTNVAKLLQFEAGAVNIETVGAALCTQDKWGLR